MSSTDELVGMNRVGALLIDGVLAAGSPAPTYAVTAGSLPAGLVVNSTTGAITGTATSGGAYSFTVTATNGEGTATALFTGTVFAPPTAFSDGTIGDLKVGTEFNDAVAADGTAEPTYAVTAGALPHGLALNVLTGAITGTPLDTAEGPYSFT